jgi:hypothetical protein
MNTVEKEDTPDLFAETVEQYAKGLPINNISVFLLQRNKHSLAGKNVPIFLIFCIKASFLLYLMAGFSQGAGEMSTCLLTK